MRYAREHMIEVTFLDVLCLVVITAVALRAMGWVNRAVSREFEALELEQEAWAGIEALVALELKERGIRSTTSPRNRPTSGSQGCERTRVEAPAKSFNHWSTR